MAVGTMLSRVTGFGRVVALAYAIGYGALADTYNLANTAPNIVYELILGGVLSATLVPTFVKWFTTNDDDAAWDAASSIFTLAAAIGVGLSALIAVGAPWIIDLYTISSSSATDEKRAIATTLLRWFAPQVVCYTLVSVATALLQSRKRFGPPMFAPICNNVAVIAMLLAAHLLLHDVTLASVRDDTFALTLLGLGTTAGVLAMTLTFVPYLVQMRPGLRWHWDPGHEAVRAVVKMSGWTLGFVAANQIALWVTIAIAYGTTSAVAAFTSAYTFFILPHGVFSVSVMSALQPDLAASWASGRIDAFRSQLSSGVRLVVFVMVPAAAAYVVLSLPIVQAVLQHGRLTDHEAKMTAGMVAWMAVGLPSFSVFIFATRAFQSMQAAREVFHLYVIENTINIVTIVPLYWAFGAVGIAASQTLAYAVAALVALAHLRTLTSGIDGHRVLQSSVRTMVAGVLMVIAMSLCRWRLSGLPPLITVIAALVVGGGAYLGAARAMHMSELQALLPRRLRATGR